MGRQSPYSTKVRWQMLVVGVGVVVALMPVGDRISAQDAKPDTLHVGTSGSLTADKSKDKDKAALDSLQEFIKTETGSKNEILKQKDWQALAQTMTSGKAQVGVFQGYEYAWAQEKYPSIKPLALAVNGDRYPTVYIMVKKDNAAKDFAGLQGQSLVLPGNSPRFVQLYLNRTAEEAGKKTDAFFSKTTTQNDSIDAIDDVVEGVAQVTAVDGATLEVYKKEKPGRFGQLKELTHSQPLPPVVIAYVDKSLNDAVVMRFRDGLINANKKDRGQTMLNTFGLTGFEAIPADFEKILAATRKTYPPEDKGAK